MGLGAAIDRAIAALSPRWAASRARHRLDALVSTRAYEAANRSRLRGSSRDHGSGNSAIADSGESLVKEARHLDRNHDIVVGGLNALVQNFIGPAGIGVEPQPRDANGDIHEGLADQLRNLRAAWCKRPEVTWRHDWASASRLCGRTWVRDGEFIAHELIGHHGGLMHGSSVPYALELLEIDLLPWDFNDPARGILHGVERNGWRRPVAYHLYPRHPGDPDVFMQQTLRRIPAERIRHVALIRRLEQVRGESILASVLTRLEDVKDYEESERVAAKIAACLAAVIIKGEPEGYVGPSDPNEPERNFRFQPGMVIDKLRQGESIEMMDSKRPNSGLEAFRNAQLRAVASGMSVSFSTLAKNYNGTYSSQRQELVEQYGAYGVLAWEWISQAERPVYERLVNVAWATQQLDLPAGYLPHRLSDALYVPPAMPWINPLHEAEAFAVMEENAFMSGPEIIRRRNADPRDVLDQQSAWLRRKATWGIPPKGQASNTKKPKELRQ